MDGTDGRYQKDPNLAGALFIVGREFVYDYEKYNDLNHKTFTMYYKLSYHDIVRGHLVYFYSNSQ